MLTQIQQYLVAELKTAGITNINAIANIMAHIHAECDWEPRSENMNYSAKRLFQLYGKGNPGRNKVRFQTIADAQRLVDAGPQAIGNLLYGNRMGNNSNEGYLFRGRGMIQITGRYNYQKFGDMIGINLIESPDLANIPEVAVKITAAYFKDRARTFDLTSIEESSKAIGHAGGGPETERRGKLAIHYLGELLSAGV